MGRAPSAGGLVDNRALWITAGARPELVLLQERHADAALAVAGVLADDAGAGEEEDDMKALRFYAPKDVRLEDVPERIRDGCGAEVDVGILSGEPSTVLDLTGDEPRVLRALAPVHLPVRGDEDRLTARARQLPARRDHRHAGLLQQPDLLGRPSAQQRG